MADEEKKNPIPVGPNETANKIPPNSNSLAAMAAKGPGYISTVAAMSGHDGFNRVLLEAGKVKDPMAGQQQLMPSKQKAKQIFARGETYFDANKSKKVTIVEANAARTKKTHTPCHKVVDSRGNTWLVKESDLVRLP